MADDASDPGETRLPDPAASLFRAAPDPAIGYELVDSTPVVRAVNPAFAEAFDVDDAAGRPLAEGLIGGDRDGPDAGDLAARVADGEAVDVVLAHADGDEERYLRCRSVAAGADAAASDGGVTPVGDGDEAGYVVYTDVTERERERRALADEADRAESFASIVSHDLRNPIDVAEIRIEAARDSGEAVHFEKALGAVRRMDRIIESVRSMTLDPDHVSPRPVDLGGTVGDAWDTVDTAGAALERVDLETIEADPDYLRQLLENLFRNSMEHGVPGERDPEDATDGPLLTVRVGHLDADGEGAGFYVADDGVGIPAEDRDQVFEPRYSTADDGTGYGLAIVERIARTQGWDVSLTDSEAGGVRFEFAGVEPVRSA